MQSAHEPVTEIVNSLFLAGERRMTDCDQNDDITLVAFRLNKESKKIS